jgi:glycosyltransferase involved in cell wall biosynthesis
MPRVNVVIPSYNHGRFLTRTVRSVLDQTFQDFDLVIVDDGSTDDTEAVVSRLDARVEYVKQGNAGLGAARNTGARMADGEWLAFLDADDSWKPEKLERQLAAVTTPGPVGVVYTGAEFTDEAGHRTGVFPHTGPYGRVLDTLWKANFVCSGSNALVRRSSFERAGGFDEARVVMGVADWELWIRLAAFDEFACVEEPLICYTRRPNGMSQDYPAMMQGEYYLLHKHLDASERWLRVPGSPDLRLPPPPWSVSLARRMGRPDEARRYFLSLLQSDPLGTLAAKIPVREFLASFRRHHLAR